jgi:peptidoglycan/LPS O-acetylase OafA/YrhL
MTFGPGAFRLLLAGAVLFSHLSRWDFGRPAVMLFFMLSGYWVARMQDGPHHLPTPRYLLSRLMRIWPATAGAAIITYLAYHSLGLAAPGSLESTLAVLGLATRANDSVGTIWSLDIELQFYILLPMLLLTSSALRQRGVLAAFAVVALVAGGLLYLSAGLVSVLTFLPMFAVGLSLYLSPANASGRIAAFSLAAGFLTLTALSWPTVRFHNNPQIIRDYGFMLASLLFVPFIAWNIRQRSGDIDRLLGALSFPLYLVQEPCIIIAKAEMGQNAYWKVGALALVLTATAALYVLIDAPTERLRKRFFATSSTTYLPAPQIAG